MKVVIIGAGASGMVAGLQAAKQGDNQVILLERQSRVGKKLMATGNGRCNLTNMGASAEHYHGREQTFVQPALRRYSPEKIIQFFYEMGLLTTEEYGGRVFPRSGHAASVVDVLRLALERDNIQLHTEVQVKAVRKTDGGFEVLWDGGSIFCDRVIVACGGCAGSKIGGSMDGYDLLQQLGHSRTPLYPALTQIRTQPEYPRAMKGIKVDGGLSICHSRDVLGETQGDILFTDFGISGTAVFELSRLAASQGEGLTARIDFFPELRENDLYQHLKKRAMALAQQDGIQMFTGALQSRVAQSIFKFARVPGNVPCSTLRDRDLRNLSKGAKGFLLPITGVSGFESAQVTHGGIATEEFDPQTMESRRVSGLFACGEVLDVDGDCGGYNLQWAWASGIIAGELGRPLE